MGKYRRVHTKFWGDWKVQGLGPVDKLLFLYLITNEHVSASGLYPLTIRTMSFETGLEATDVSLSLEALSGVNLVDYDKVNRVVWVKNFLKYQDRTPNNIKSVNNDMEHCKKSFLVNDFFKAYVSLWQGLGKAPIGIGLGLGLLGVKKEESEEKEKGGEPEAEKAPRKKPGTAPPLRLATEPFLELGRELGFDVGEIAPMVASCLDHFRGKGEKRADWAATIRNWMRKERQFRDAQRKGGKTDTVKNGLMKFAAGEEGA